MHGDGDAKDAKDAPETYEEAAYSATAEAKYSSSSSAYQATAKDTK